MIYFFDRCIPYALAAMTAALEPRHTITHHDKDDRFNQHTSDVEWMRVIGSDRPKPIVISGDGKILKRPDEIATLSEQDLTFFLMDGNFQGLGARTQAWTFFKAWEKIIDICMDGIHKPTVFRVRLGSSLKVDKECLTRDLKK